jgi:hypothetical protein
MLPKTHMIIGAIASIAIFLIFPSIGIFYFLVILLSSFLIDVDHYLYYAWKNKDMSLKNAYHWFIEKIEKFKKMKKTERDRYQKVIMFFHGIEAWIILALAILVHKIFFYVLIGFAIHMIMDFIDIFIRKEKFYPKLSTLYTIKKNRKLRKFD